VGLIMYRFEQIKNQFSFIFLLVLIDVHLTDA
jgi:hypothetical protein